MFNIVTGYHHLKYVFMIEIGQIGLSKVKNKRWLSILQSNSYEACIQLVNYGLQIPIPGSISIYVECSNWVPQFKVSVYDLNWSKGVINTRWLIVVHFNSHQTCIQLVNYGSQITIQGSRSIYVGCSNCIPQFKVSVYDLIW